MTLQINPNTVIGKAISRGMSPKQADMLTIPLPFGTDATIQVSLNVLSGVRNVSGIPGIQSVYIDNSMNGSTTMLTFDSGQSITCPSYAQAIFPVFFSGQMLNFIATSSGGVGVTAIFLNTREQAQLWSTKIPLAGTVNISGSTIFSSITAGAITDRGATLAVAATSQKIMDANGNRLSWRVRNPATAASQGIAAPEPIVIAFGAAAVLNAASGYELLPGESVGASEFGIDSTQQINFIASTAGHIVHAQEM